MIVRSAGASKVEVRTVRDVPTVSRFGTLRIPACSKAEVGQAGNRYINEQMHLRPTVKRETIIERFRHSHGITSQSCNDICNITELTSIISALHVNVRVLGILLRSVPSAKLFVFLHVSGQRSIGFEFACKVL